MFGGVAEWLRRGPAKTCPAKNRAVGSNPTPSATNRGEKWKVRDERSKGGWVRTHEQPNGRFTNQFERNLQDNRFTKKYGFYRFQIPPLRIKSQRSKVFKILDSLLTFEI